MLNLPAGIISLTPAPHIKVLNQRLMRHLADESKTDLNHQKVKEFAEKLFSQHITNSDSDITKPFGIFSNSLLHNKPTLFLMVPVYSDEGQSKIFIFAFKQDKNFSKEEILYNTDVWHDINNPLAILMLASNKADDEKELLEQKDIDKFFTIIKDVTNRINKLGDNFIEKLGN